VDKSKKTKNRTPTTATDAVMQENIAYNIQQEDTPPVQVTQQPSSQPASLREDK
jgi:hypothetical protein